MSTNDVFALASRQASWLLARQAAVAQNVANANTPGYKATDMAPFEANLQQSALQLAVTSPGHMSLGGDPAAQAAADKTAADDGETAYSGNNVSLEQEMMKAGEVARAYSLNTAVVKSFNSMILQAAKG